MKDLGRRSCHPVSISPHPPHPLPPRFHSLSRAKKSAKKRHHPSNLVQRQLTTAMKAFLSHQSSSPTAHRAITTASLSLLRNSCATTVPSKLSVMAAHTLLQALSSESSKNDVRPEVTLGSEGFPESQVAAFLLDATRVETPPPPSVPIIVSPEITAKVDLNMITQQA